MQVEIILNKERVGTAQVSRQGLYWCFECRCQLPGVCVLEVQTQRSRERLGIPVPEGGAFCLRKQLPISRLGDGAMTIWALPKGKGRFVAVDPCQPFAPLSDLPRGTYQQRNGQPGVFIGE